MSLIVEIIIEVGPEARDHGRMPAPPKRDRLHPTIDAQNLLPGLEPEILTQMLAKGTLVNLGEDVVIVKHGAEVHSFSVVLKGVIAFSYPVSGEQALVCELRKAPAFFHHSELIGGFTATATITTFAPTQLLHVDRAAITQAVRASQSLWQILMYESARRIERVSFLLRTAALDDPDQRVAKFLLELLDAFGLPAEGGTMIRKPLTQEQIADMIGLHRRSVIRAMQSFACVEKRGDVYVVTDVDKLRSYAS